MARQVPIVGILMMVWGGLLTLLAGMIVCSSPLAYLENEDVAVIIFGLLLATVYGVCGIGHLVAGWFCRQYKGRILAVVVLCSGFLSCPFCGVLSLALPIYGLIVLLNSDSVHAFLVGGVDEDELF